MRWYFEILGMYTPVLVCMNGANCCALCFRNEEFEEIVPTPQPLITFTNPEPLADQL